MSAHHDGMTTQYSVEKVLHETVVTPVAVLSDEAKLRRLAEIHKPVRFTNADLGIIDVTVCVTCHGILDKPDDFPDDDDTWDYPLVQDPWPCKTARILGLDAR